MEATHTIVQNMKDAAWAASKHSYSPYSNFRVGAAVLTDSGAVYSGCNIENASYGLSICAERNACFQAISKGNRKITALVVVADSPLPTPPCGACRQVINEFGERAEVFCFNQHDSVLSLRIDQLLPEAFGTESLDSSPRGPRS